ncbi:MAG: hypothetical protein GC165_09575 [Armatimonadetes bacterium]|nr:hypothetical protein [Armatimonadota bacterium]
MEHYAVALLIVIFDAKAGRSGDGRSALVADNQAGALKSHLDLARRLVVAGTRNLKGTDVGLHIDLTGFLRSLRKAWDNADQR